ncbi:hypothetical protein [Cupriavidus sp. D384]|uniref:hypothetical protein n=1 Tax=Cupriavidus sp. D384 TaxID=1538095 RepID=UPI0008302DE9|nr:hypothetical protein [Cupriavidus sp. D384]
MTRIAIPAIRWVPALCAAALATLGAGCSSTPAGPQITPVNATIKLGHVTEKTFLSRVDVPQGSSYGGYGMGVGGVAAGGGGGGGGVGVGFSIDLSRLLNPPPPPVQMDLYQYKVRTTDGTVAQVNGPAAPGLEPGTCVRLIYPDGSTQPQMAPSNEC